MHEQVFLGDAIGPMVEGVGVIEQEVVDPRILLPILVRHPRFVFPCYLRRL